ncbi:hypothetical protein V2A60_009411 [Cordyceps javanica]
MAIVRPLNPAGIIPTPAELALNEYFRKTAILYSPDEFNREFWQYSLLQVSHGVTAVWHATNAAAGSLWARDARVMQAPGAAHGIREEAVKQHTLSLKFTLMLTQGKCLSEQDKTMVLLSNVLLVACAHHPQDWDVYCTLIAKSLALIRYWKFWECIDSRSTLAVQVLYYFIKVERIMYESKSQTLQIPPQTWHEAIACLRGQPLTSAIRAYVELELFYSSARAILDCLPARPSSVEIASARASFSVLEQHFADWETRYDALTLSAVILDPLPLTTLGVRRLLLNALLKLDIDRSVDCWDETCWDDVHIYFSKSLDLLDAFLCREDDDDAAGQEAQFHKLRPLLWNSLNFIARVCRAPLLRRKATSLLQASLRDAVRGIPAAPASYVPRADAHPPLINYIIALEEGAHAVCGEPQKCVRGQFVCNIHRVATVHTNREKSDPVFILRTVGDMLDGREGHIVHSTSLARSS